MPSAGQEDLSKTKSIATYYPIPSHPTPKNNYSSFQSENKRDIITMISKDKATKKEEVGATTTSFVPTAMAPKRIRSCPVKVEGLRNSLKTSIDSKRKSMTHAEVLFVEDVLNNESLDEEELETINEVLRCDQTFFHHPETNTTTAKEHEPTQDKPEPNAARSSMSSPSSSPPPKLLSRRCSAPVDSMGSKKRQDLIDARKKQAAELCKKRAKANWRKAAIKARAVGRLYTASVPRVICEEEEHQSSPLVASSKKSMPRNEDPVEVKAENKEANAAPPTRKPVFFRQASINVYEGEGIEISAELEDDLGDNNDDVCEEETKDDETQEDEDTVDETIRSFTAFGEATLTPRGEGFRRASVNIYGGKGFEVAEEDLFEEVYDGDDRRSYEDYDPWLFQETDMNGKRRDFAILGTSHDDLECHPHVLSPVQMDRFQPLLPDIKRGESFWLKYSLVRDGASTISFLKQVRASPYTLLAIETVGGEVFGGFFANAWTVQSEYFGTGASFLWRMKHARKVPQGSNNSGEDGGEGSLEEQIERESDLEFFPAQVYYGNNLFQLCHQDKITAGGGTTSTPQNFGVGNEASPTYYSPHQIGFGLLLGRDGSLLEGSSSASLTFRNPPLAKAHEDGSTFEVLNLEAWGFTPCLNEEEARILEYKNMFFKRHASSESF